MWEDLLISFPLLRNALMSGLLVGLLAPLVGAYFILRRIVLLGVAVPQVSAAGMAFALMAQGLQWFGLSPMHGHGGFGLLLLGSFLFTLIVIVALGLLVNRNPGAADIVIGVMFAVAGAASILFLAQSPAAEGHMLSLLKGEMIAIADADLVRTAFLAAIVLGLFLFFHKEFLLVAFDRDFAATVRKPVGRIDVLFYAVAGFGVTVCVLTAGPVTTFGYLVFPPVIALLFARGMTRFLVASVAVGMTGSVLGLLVAFFLDWPVGPTGVGILALAWILGAGARAGFRWTEKRQV